MAFKTVVVYDLDGEFLGYSIFADGAKKLHTANLWSESTDDVVDLQAQLARLRDQGDVLAFWPNVRDPEVQALLNDPTFESLALSPVEVVDDERSVFVWIEEPSDENPFGKMDRDASTIVHKTQMAPSPVDVQARVKKACEIVARRRANSA